MYQNRQRCCCFARPWRGIPQIPSLVVLIRSVTIVGAALRPCNHPSKKYPSRPVIRLRVQQLSLSVLRNFCRERDFDEEENRVYFCCTAIVFCVGISGIVSFAVRGAAPGVDQGLPERSWTKQREMS